MVLAAALVVVVLLVLLARCVPALPSPFDDVLIFVLFAVHMFLTLGLFLAMPQALALFAFAVSNFWIRLAAGMASGWIFLFVSFVEFRISVLATGRPPLDVLPLYAGLLFAAPRALFAAFLAATSRPAFFWLAAIGAVLCGFAWRNMIYMLAGDRARDWETRILGVAPPYAR